MAGLTNGKYVSAMLWPRRKTPWFIFTTSHTQTCIFSHFYTHKGCMWCMINAPMADKNGCRKRINFFYDALCIDDVSRSIETSFFLWYVKDFFVYFFIVQLFDRLPVNRFICLLIDGSIVFGVMLINWFFVRVLFFC